VAPKAYKEDLGKVGVRPTRRVKRRPEAPLKKIAKPFRRKISKAITSSKTGKPTSQKLVKVAKSAKSKTAKSIKRLAAKPPERKSSKVLKPLKRGKRKSAKPTKTAKRKLVKPIKRRPAKLAKRASTKTAKLAKRKLAKPSRRKPAKPVRRKPAKLVRRKPAKPRKFKKRALPERPLISNRALAAEAEIHTRAVMVMESLELIGQGLDMAAQSFVNSDGTVDGEVRVGNLPDEWRVPEGLPDLIATLSNAFLSFRQFDVTPPMGGKFWITFGIRFGAQNESEAEEFAKLYKEYRGLFQIGTYPTRADNLTPIQLSLTDERHGLRSMINAVEEKRGMPPTSILVRFVWTPDGSRPAHYEGEK
jgi:hypothetical protein